MKKTSTKTLLKNRTACKGLFLFLLSFVPLAQLFAANITVSSLSALQTAINAANPGDVITLTNGVYTSTADITINKQGTASQLITIQAQSILGVEIKGSNGFAVNSPARYIVIKGFKFTHASSQATIASGTSFIRWTQNLFQTTGDGEYLQINGNDQEIDHNTFQNKNSLGKFITVRGTGSQVAQRLWIHHNYFFNQDPQSGNGNETIQFGLSGYSLSNSNSIFEYNLFEQCEGENELLSVKASQLIIRYNTIRNCPAQFTLRHGNRCEVYGNYFINTPGLRIFGDDHKIYSNHFESCNPAINIGNGDGEVADGDPLTAHDRPDRNLIVYNTMVNNTSNYTQAGRTNGLGATATTFANNIIQGGGSAASIAGPYTNPTWSNNIIYQTSSAGAIPSGGYTNTNPLLARDGTGTFHLQSGSPAINAGTGSYSWATADMDGQSRTSPFDIGADEVSGAAVTAQILSPSMVGPNAVDPGGPTCVPVSASADDGNVPANVLDNNLATRWSASGDGQWIQFCLDESVSVTGVQIAFYSGDVRTSTFDVLVGSNGTSWTTAASNRVSSGTSTALETFTFTPVTGKYVRIVGHGNSVNLWNSYSEVKIQTAGSGGGQTFTLTPEADAYVRDGTNAAITHGTTDPTLLITKVSPSGQLNNARESYLRFDLASVSGTVSAATLRVYGKIDLTTVPSVPIGIYSVANTTWSESALTWNNKPASGAGLDTSTVTNTAYAYITWDVTSYVQAELSASRSKVSFAMKSLTAHDPRVFWNSKEFGSNPPQLVVETEEGLAAATTQKTAQLESSPALRSLISTYPNPFRSSSNIAFRIQQSGHTELTAFDLQGRRVAVLVNGYLSAGEHRTLFTAPAGAKGIYLLRLVNGGKAVTHRIVQE